MDGVMGTHFRSKMGTSHNPCHGLVKERKKSIFGIVNTLKFLVF